MPRTVHPLDNDTALRDMDTALRDMDTALRDMPARFDSFGPTVVELRKLPD